MLCCIATLWRRHGATWQRRSGGPTPSNTATKWQRRSVALLLCRIDTAPQSNNVALWLSDTATQLHCCFVAVQHAAQTVRLRYSWLIRSSRERAPSSYRASCSSSAKLATRWGVRRQGSAALGAEGPQLSVVDVERVQGSDLRRDGVQGDDPETHVRAAWWPSMMRSSCSAMSA